MTPIGLSPHIIDTDLHRDIFDVLSQGTHITKYCSQIGSENISYIESIQTIFQKTMKCSHGQYPLNGCFMDSSIPLESIISTNCIDRKYFSIINPKKQTMALDIHELLPAIKTLAQVSAYSDKTLLISTSELTNQLESTGIYNPHMITSKIINIIHGLIQQTPPYTRINKERALLDPKILIAAAAKAFLSESDSKHADDIISVISHVMTTYCKTWLQANGPMYACIKVLEILELVKAAIISSEKAPLDKKGQTIADKNVLLCFCYEHRSEGKYIQVSTAASSSDDICFTISSILLNGYLHLEHAIGVLSSTSFCKHIPSLDKTKCQKLIDTIASFIHTSSFSTQLTADLSAMTDEEASACVTEEQMESYFYTTQLPTVNECIYLARRCHQIYSTIKHSQNSHLKFKFYLKHLSRDPRTDIMSQEQLVDMVDSISCRTLSHQKTQWIASECNTIKENIIKIFNPTQPHNSKHEEASAISQHIAYIIHMTVPQENIFISNIKYTLQTIMGNITQGTSIPEHHFTKMRKTISISEESDIFDVPTENSYERFQRQELSRNLAKKRQILKKINADKRKGQQPSEEVVSALSSIELKLDKLYTTLYGAASTSKS